MNEINEALEQPFDFKTARKSFSRIGMALLLILLIASVLQALCVSLPPLIWGEDNWLSTSSWGLWIITFVPLYLISVPIGLLILKKLPAKKPVDEKLGAKRFLSYIPLCFFMMYTGSFIGTILSSLLSGGMAQNALLNYAMDTNPIKVLVIVILAPLLEELVFRKQLIDRCRKYGEKWAVVLSGVCFGLFHANLFQFFYAFALGLLFAYIYIRTGRLRYPVILHCIINFVGSVIAPWLLTNVDIEAISALDPMGAPEEALNILTENALGLAAYGLFTVFVAVMFFWGLALFIMKVQKLRWEEAEKPLPVGSGFKTVYLNPGMIIFVVFCLITTIAALFI